MDVRCTRCGTEYEFDDALISERGTSVRCTQCGFQFKVFPPQVATMGPDEWVVLTSLGRRVVYRTLRELQNGISKSEVAREDLLARGSKPPRPLGSIAELDPLFATKAAPERQPSTLTGVAPPPAQVGGKPIPPPGGSLGRQGHDTFSGVAPPANSPAGGSSELASPEVARQAPPLRVGGSTVLGIGLHSGADPDPNAEEPSRSGKPSGADSNELRPQAVTTQLAPSTSAPPETRSFESFRPDALVPVKNEQIRTAAAEPLASSSEPPTNRPPPPAASHSAASPSSDLAEPNLAPPLVPGRRQTEAGLLPHPQSAAAAPLSVVSEAAAVEPPPPLLVSPEVLASNVEASSSGSKARANAGGTTIAKVRLTSRVATDSAKTTAATAGVSDPPTARWAGQSLGTPARSVDTALPHEPKLEMPPREVSHSQPATARSVDLELHGPSVPTRSKESPRPSAATRFLGTGSAGAEPLSASGSEASAPVVSESTSAKSSGASGPGASRSPASKSTKREHSGSLEDVSTAPPARTRSKLPPTNSALAVSGGGARHSVSSAARLAERGAAATVVPDSQRSKPLFSAGRVIFAVALLGLAMFAGMKIVGTQLHPEKPLPAPSRVPVAMPQPVLAAWDPPIVEMLKVGDEQGAGQLLSRVSTENQGQAQFRRLRAQWLALSADLMWWKVQLVGKNAGDAYTESKQQLTERLQSLRTELAAMGPEAEWPETVQAASLDARRMQGDKSEPSERSLVERLKNPTSPELKYTQLVLAWVRAGHPDESTVVGLRQLRAEPLDLGPRAVALIVALVQLNQLPDAKAELERRAAMARPHPLINEMQAYIRNAETTPDAGTMAESAEPGESDPALLEGDFRLRLTRASECLSRNELTKAQKLLRSVLAQRPNDTEAITAMGDVLRRRGDLNQSRSLYDKALALNANYLPAMSGAADLRWKSGDRTGAAALYRRILERVGETPGYGQVAAARLKELEAAAKPAQEPNAATDRESAAARDGKSPNTDVTARPDKTGPKATP